VCAFLLQSRTRYPVPVPAARAGECLLILFPRTGTGTDFSPFDALFSPLHA